MCLYYYEQCNKYVRFWAQEDHTPSFNSLVFFVFRYPGLFLYEMTHPKMTLDMLKDEPGALPPEYKFANTQQNWREGVSLASFSRNE